MDSPIQLQRPDGLRRRRTGGRANNQRATEEIPHSAPVENQNPFQWNGQAGQRGILRPNSWAGYGPRTIEEDVISHWDQMCRSLTSIPEGAALGQYPRAGASPHSSIARLASTDPGPSSAAEPLLPPSDRMDEPAATAENSRQQRIWKMVCHPATILATELLTNVTGLTSTVAGPLGYDRLANAANSAVGLLGGLNGAQLYRANWVNAAPNTQVSELAVAASVASLLNAGFAATTAWWLTEPRRTVDFHSNAGALAAIFSEAADLRDAINGLRRTLNGQREHLPRSAALMVRVVMIVASAMCTMVAIWLEGNERDATHFRSAAAAFPIAGTVAGGAAELLNHESVRNWLRARLDEIASLIGGSGPAGFPDAPGASGALDPSP